MALQCIKVTTPKRDTNATQHGPYMSVVTTTEITLNAHQSKRISPIVVLLFRNPTIGKKIIDTT